MNNLNKTDRNEIVIIAGLLCVGFLLRFYLFHLHKVIDYDGVYYAMLGKNLFSGNGYIEPEGIYQWYYPPLYPLNIGILWKLSGNLEVSSKLVSLIYGTLILPLTYLIAKKFYNFKVGIIATALVALHPNMIRFSTTDTAESLFIFILLLAIYLTLYAIESNKLIIFSFIGVLFGMLFLCKPAGVQYLAGYTLFFIFIGLLEKWGIKTVITRTIMIVIMFLIIATPYLFFLKKHYGYWTLSELATRNLARSLLISAGDNDAKVYQLNDDRTELKYFTSDTYSGKHISILSNFKENPENFIRRYFSNLRDELILIFDGIRIFAIPLLIFLFAGFFRIFFNKKVKIRELILFSIFIPFLTAPLVSAHSPRWVLPMVPVLLIWSSIGIVDFQEKLNKSHGQYFQLFTSKFTAFVLLIWLLAITGPFIQESKSYAHSYPYEHKELGVWMKKNLKINSSTTVMSASPHVSFYAGTKLKIMPWGNAEEIIEYAKYCNIKFLVIDKHFLGSFRSQLNRLDNIEHIYPDMELVKEIRNVNGKWIKLYRLI